MLSGEPRNRQELLDELRAAQENGLVSADSLAMIEGALAVHDKTVGDVMVPRAKMVSVAIDDEFEHVLNTVVESGHSRFPITGEDRDEVIGILLAKDLLRCVRDGGDACRMKKLVRPVMLVPASKPLDILLKEFRSKRNHMAVVVDEYGGVGGLVTIEDVLEEIVGDIDDEHDDAVAETDAHRNLPDGRVIINAQMPIADFNDRFNAEFSDEDFDTVGGLISSALGHLPIVGENAEVEGFVFQITKADNRRLHQVAVRTPLQ